MLLPLFKPIAACCSVQISYTDRHTAVLSTAEIHLRLHVKYVFHYNLTLSQYIFVDISCSTLYHPKHEECGQKSTYALTKCMNVKADSNIACRAHAAPMTFPCHAVPLRV